MKFLKLYKVLTYILFLFGGMLAFNVLSVLTFALSNPGLLLVSFIIACVPIYIFTSGYFFLAGVEKARPCKPSLKEWININAFVSIFFAAILLIICLLVLVIIDSPSILTDTMKQMSKEQKEVLRGWTVKDLIRQLQIFVAIVLPLGIILIVHVLFTFRMLKFYRHVFDKA